MKTIHFFLIGIIFLNGIRAGDLKDKRFIQRIQAAQDQWKKRMLRKKVSTPDHNHMIKELQKAQNTPDPEPLPPSWRDIEVADLKDIEENNPRVFTALMCNEARKQREPEN